MGKDRHGTPSGREDHAAANKSESRQLKRKHRNDGPDQPVTRAPKPKSGHPLPGTGQDKQPARPPIRKTPHKQAGGHSRNWRPKPLRSQSPRQSSRREDNRRRERGAKERRDSSFHDRGKNRGGGFKDRHERDGRGRNE
ncbi:hypothetical protein MRS44_009760 [Fusarium solani]|uniref:uncharacterized protein n=1 Tax=Fusarium solani TaxID=169388 RepID=UPI0032C478EA|nr:hypothetical protein MRS44_009760 [Fusarium solani]